MSTVLALITTASYVVTAAGLLGGFVRGFSGFGFSLAAVPILALTLPTVQIVPAILPIEIAFGLATIPAQWRHVAWHPFRWLILGTLVGTQIGLIILTSLPPEVLRILVGVTVLAAVALMCRSRPNWSLQPRGLWLTGLLSGLLNGATSLSGPPAILALLGSGLVESRARATMMAFVGASAVIAATAVWLKGLYGWESAATSLGLLPAGLVGGILGTVTFRALPTQTYRPISLAILATISLIVLGTSLNEYACANC
ncbi:hypothetical protein ASF58_20000 [Methylobacterium sp. Leaf125]|uniref:sulfite exporter TauE/SafE family protein n=1 Tax=Methylobacterium sp. Leaf125 TaxID=1736265 RepID=UPI0006F5034F|nr:sulfite exporter TauE/SafE family protein [Methylobacterium sp. Leaf125]KQQ45008.1 hypothetical protein ASF58_20000 [Methylobacterium sp. Leaf125]